MMGSASGYTIADYGQMVTDPSRVKGYLPALREAIKPGSIVLDIGAGPGVFALIACQLGAAHVFAIEPDASIELGRDLAKRNGFGGRIEFIRNISTKVDLPQPADVVVSDLRGVLPLYQHHIPSIVDARRRHLAPGGKLIPKRDEIWVAVVEDKQWYRGYGEPWASNELDLDLAAGLNFTANSWMRMGGKVPRLLTAPQRWIEIDYMSVEHPNFSGTLSWKIDDPGIAHGLLVWFDADLGDGFGYSNRPGSEDLIYGRAFFPLQKPVSLENGDEVQVQLSANLVNDDYVWSWKTKIEGPGSSTAPKTSFQQSTFFSTPASLAKLKHQQSDFVPKSTEEIEIDRTILLLVDGRQSLDAIARTIAIQFPHRFARWQDALSRVATITARYQAETA